MGNFGERICGNLLFFVTIRFMTERELFIGPNRVNNIPGDTPNSLWTVGFSFEWDAFMQFNDSTGKTYLPMMRFRSQAGGGFLPLISEELSILPRAFMENGGQIVDHGNQNEANNQFPSWLNIDIRVGKTPSESKYIIKGIPDGDANPEDNNKFLDIEITNEGNAILTMRDTRRNNSALMEFKTKENGGRYPIMAAVFTRIAERIAKTKKNKF